MGGEATFGVIFAALSFLLVGFANNRTFLIHLFLGLEGLFMVTVTLALQLLPPSLFFAWTMLLVTWIVLAAALGLSLLVNFLRFRDDSHLLSLSLQ